MSFNNVNSKKDRLYRINVTMGIEGNVFTMGSTPRPMAAALKADIPGIVNAARVSDEEQRLLFGFENKSVYAFGLCADSSLFSMFTLTFLQGNARTAFTHLHSLVLTEKSVKKFFGEEKNVLGKTVRIDNKEDYVITGVLKDMPENSTLQFEWLAPYQIISAEPGAKSGNNADDLDWGSYGPFTYVELNVNANPVAVNKQVRDLIHRKNPDQKSQLSLFAMPYWRLYDEFENGKATGSGRIKQVHLLSLIAWIILFIACINFMNLATANSQKRAKEVGVRKVLGAGRKGLIIHFFAETLQMATMAAIAAIIIMAFALPAFNTLMQKQLSLSLGNPSHITALLLITIICGLAAGSYPSMYLSSFNPALVLKGWKLQTGSAALIRKGLVVLQFTVSVVFIISTMIVYLQIQHVKDRPLGFNKDNLVEADMQHDIGNTFAIIKKDLLQTGIIENVAMTDHTTIHSGDSDDRFTWEGKLPGNDVGISYRNVSPEFITTSGMQITDGHDFDERAGSEVIITESLAKIMGKESVVGKIIQSPRGNKEGHYTNFEVAGVVKDYIYGNAYGTPGPVLFFCRPPENSHLVYVRIKPQTNASQVLEKIESVLKKDNPAYPFVYKFVDDQFNQLFQNEMLISKISGVFATLAIIISCLGLFGLAAFTAGARTKEIGVRKVLGASAAGIAGMLSKDFLQLVIVSCLVAFPVAWWIMHSWLQNYQYRIVISWWIFLMAGLVAVFIALITVSTQAIKAATVNPVNSLRTE